VVVMFVNFIAEWTYMWTGCPLVTRYLIIIFFADFNDAPVACYGLSLMIGQVLHVVICYHGWQFLCDD